jgi:hypothetical protein
MVPITIVDLQTTITLSHTATSVVLKERLGNFEDCFRVEGEVAHDGVITVLETIIR